MIGTVPLMQLCLENLEVVVAPGIGEPQHGRKASEARKDRQTRRDTCMNSQSVAMATNNTNGHDKFLSADGMPLRFRVARGALDSNQSLQRALADRQTLMLSPGPGATDIESLELSADTPRTLIVIDGTWKQASRLVMEPIIQEAVGKGSVTRIQLARAGRSQYMFRMEPQEDCLSSLESVAYCLRFLERNEQGELAVSHLLRSFGLMVTLQVRRVQRSPLMSSDNRSQDLSPDSFALLDSCAGMILTEVPLSRRLLL